MNISTTFLNANAILAQSAILETAHNLGIKEPTEFIFRGESIIMIFDNVRFEENEIDPSRISQQPIVKYKNICIYVNAPFFNTAQWIEIPF